MKLHNHYTCTCILLRGVLTLTSVLQESQGLTTCVSISDDISTHANVQVDGYHGC